MVGEGEKGNENRTHKADEFSILHIGREPWGHIWGVKAG